MTITIFDKSSLFDSANPQESTVGGINLQTILTAIESAVGNSPLVEYDLEEGCAKSQIAIVHIQQNKLKSIGDGEIPFSGKSDFQIILGVTTQRPGYSEREVKHLRYPIEGKAKRFVFFCLDVERIKDEKVMRALISLSYENAIAAVNGDWDSLPSEIQYILRSPHTQALLPALSILSQGYLAVWASNQDIKDIIKRVKSKDENDCLGKALDNMQILEVLEKKEEIIQILQRNTEKVQQEDWWKSLPLKDDDFEKNVLRELEKDEFEPRSQIKELLDKIKMEKDISFEHAEIVAGAYNEIYDFLKEKMS